MAKEKSFEDDYKEFLETLNKHKVDYLVVGGYATMYHTKIPRATKDIDIWIRPTEDNAQRVADAIKEFNGMSVSKEDFLKSNEIFYMGTVPFRIDVFNSQGNISFVQAWKNRIKEKFYGIKAYFICKEHLLELKKQAGRDQDLVDIKLLKKVKENNN